mgnify:CR=1 FL=1
MPGPIVASDPETDAIMPRRIFTSRAYQFVPDPVSQAIMHFSGRRGESSQKTRWGLSGSAEFIARFSSTSHQLLIFFSIPSRHEPDGEELNYPFVFAELDRLAYGGFVGCEYNPRGKTTDGLAWFKPYAGVKP